MKKANLVLVISLFFYSFSLVASDRAQRRVQQIVGQMAPATPAQKKLTTQPVVGEQRFIETMSKEYGKELRKYRKPIEAHIATFENIFAHSAQLREEHYVDLYHAGNGVISILQDLTFLLENHKAQQQGKSIRSDFVYLRSPGTGSSYADVQDFLRANASMMRAQRFADSRPEYRDILLSVNIGFLGNVYARGSCTLDYLLQGTSIMLRQGDQEKILGNLLSALLKRYDISGNYSSRLVWLAKKYLDDKRFLLQIGVPEKQIDRYVYIAAAGGAPLGTPLEYSPRKSEDVADLLRRYHKKQEIVAPNDWDKEERYYRAASGVIAAYEKDPFSILGGEELQPRILITNEVLDPSNGWKITRYWTSSKSEVDLDKKMTQYYEILSKEVDAIVNKKPSFIQQIMERLFQATKQPQKPIVSIEPIELQRPLIGKEAALIGKESLSRLLKPTLEEFIAADDIEAVKKYVPTINQQQKNEAFHYVLDQLGDTIVSLLSAGKDPKSYVTKSLLNKKLEMIKVLLAQGADINARDYDGSTVLMKAAMADYLDIVKYLASQGADIFARNRGRTAQQSAKLFRSTKTTQFLKEEEERQLKTKNPAVKSKI